MNIFEFKDFRFMIDFAHNPDGFNGIKEFLRHVDSPLKIGIIAGTGDRRDEDIREIGKISAEMFDYIILRQEKHLRGRTEENILSLLIEGIKSVDQNKKFEIVPKEIDAIKHAMSLAKPGTFIVALSDVIDNAIETVQNYQEQERNGLFNA
jgi:cyanophycin synthetase